MSYEKENVRANGFSHYHVLHNRLLYLFLDCSILFRYDIPATLIEYFIDRLDGNETFPFTISFHMTFRVFQWPNHQVKVQVVLAILVGLVESHTILFLRDFRGVILF